MQLYDINLASRLLLVTAQYPSPQVLTDAISASGCGVITGLLRREIAGARGANGFWPLLQATGARILPNTAGCHSAREANTTAHMAREVFGTNWIKLEVIGNADTLQPDLFALVEAARVLCADGFAVFPYTTEDLIVAERLLGAGCRVLMPWGAPIGSGRGLRHVNALASMRGHFPGVPLIIDAGIGAPSQAAQAMEMGFDAVLLNTAVAKAGDPVAMARAFGQAVAGGFCGATPSYRAVFPDQPAQAASCASAGVLGPAVAALGAVQAQMALSVLIGMEPSPLGRMATLDMASWRCGGFGFEDATEAPGFGFVAATQIVATDTVIDLRPAGSVQALPGAQVLVPGDLADWPVPAGRVVLCCSTGLRSWPIMG